jgi:hypothetical protein
MKRSTSRPESDEKKSQARRKHRARPTPKWLLERQELDEIAKRRCLMVLTVLSGRRPVTDVIAEVQMSRGTYYKLEERAVGAMLRALSPTAGPDGTDGQALAAALSRVEELEGKLARAEQDRRRSDKLLLLTKKIVKAGPLVTGSGRPPGSRNRRRSMTGEPKPSPASNSSPAAATTGSGAATSSTPTAGGATER